jgi:hypothetical protein
LTNQTNKELIKMGYEGSDTVSAQLLKKYEETVIEYKELNGQLEAADGNRDAAIEAWEETSEDPQAVKLRTQIENAVRRLREMAEKNVQEVVLSDEERAKLETLLESKKDEIKKGKKTVKEVSDMLGADHEGVMKALEEIGDPTGSGRGRKPGDSGSSLPRVSVIATLTGGNFPEGKTYDSFSPMAKDLNVDVKDLQVAFAEAAGVAHEEIKTVRKPVTFEFQAHENGSTYTISTKPKPRKTRSDVAVPPVLNGESKTDGPTTAPDFEKVNA